MSTHTTAMREIAAALAAASGIDTGTLKDNRLQWIVESRCRALHLPDATAYAAALAASAEELEALIDAAVVPETRFFRDKAVFEHLRRWAAQQAEPHAGELRILSAPCSTGQEAYSAAATLQQAGIAPSRFSITGIDLSQAALRTARRALYPAEAMRKIPEPQQTACGAWDGKHWQMHHALRQRIHFRRINLAQPHALGDEKYHLILCRNLFIYLRPEARRTLAQSLAAALLPGGRLILGTADHVDELNPLFAAIKPAASFAFMHRAEVATETVPAVSTLQAASLLVHRPHRRHTLPLDTHATPRKAQPTAASLFHSASHLFQQGEVQRAEHRCRQALYLEPTYLPAMELLETLWRDLPDQRLRRALAARIHRSRNASLQEAR